MASSGQQAATEPQIDDPEDLQNDVISRSLQKSPDFKIGKDIVVIGSGILPQRWKRLQRPVRSVEAARQLLRDAARNGLDQVEMRELCRRLPTYNARLDPDEMQAMVAAALASGELWIIRRRARPEKSRADPKVFEELNGTYGTKIDFEYLAQWEGGQFLHGYVPVGRRPGDIVAGRSGVTIATGFDIGQKSRQEIHNMAISAALKDKLDDFAGKTFKGKTRSQVIAEIITIGAPVPVITKAEADLLDKLVHGEHLAAAIAAYDGARKLGVPTFTQLPEPWQTVLFSRFFHQGKGAHRTGVIRAFWQAVTAGEWDAARAALAAYPVPQSWYKERVGKEAKHLEKETPAYRPPPKKGASAAPPRPGPAPIRPK